MSWITDYLDYTAHQESPTRFHFWSAVTAVGAMLGRKVWLDRRSHGITRYRIYPGQVMVILVGDSGRVRKSTALRAVKTFLKKAEINLIQGKASPEGFLDQMDPRSNEGKGARSMLLEGELSVFLSKQAYAEPLIDLFMKLFDAEDEFVFHTRGGGRMVIPQPCLTILGATTPLSLGESIPEKAHGGGFLGRVIFVYERDSDRVEDLLDIDDSELDVKQLAKTQELEIRLGLDIERMKALSGPFLFTPRGREWMHDFYLKWTCSQHGRGEGWPARRPDHMLRLAMIMVASQQNDLVIDENVLMATDAALKTVEEDFAQVFAHVGTSASKDKDRIISALQSAGGRLSAQALWLRIHQYFPDSESIRRMINLLKESGLVDHQLKRMSNGQTVEYWFLTSGTRDLVEVLEQG